MIPIVEWLREKARCGCSCSSRSKEAADEIERIREQMKMEVGAAMEHNCSLWDENEKLRKQLLAKDAMIERLKNE